MTAVTQREAAFTVAKRRRSAIAAYRLELRGLTPGAALRSIAWQCAGPDVELGAMRVAKALECVRGYGPTRVSDAARRLGVEMHERFRDLRPVDAAVLVGWLLTEADRKDRAGVRPDTADTPRLSLRGPRPSAPSTSDATTPCRVCGAPVPAGAAWCPACSEPTGR